MGDRIFVGGGGPDYAAPQELLLKYGNRHGLIAGATGTGKTVTLQILAEGFSDAGVPVWANVRFSAGSAVAWVCAFGMRLGRGVVVVGENVRLSTVAVQQGNLTISVQESPTVSQPAPFSQGQTAVVPQSDVTVEEETGRQFLQVKQGSSLQSLVTALNALGVTPRDMISILQTIKAAGALQADIEVM